MDVVSQAWLSSKFPKPKVLYGFYQNKWYLTTDDSQTIFFFLSDIGQVFVAARFKCLPVEIKNSDGKSTQVYYNIPEDRALQVVSCPTGPFRERDRYALEHIKPLVFPN